MPNPFKTILAILASAPLVVVLLNMVLEWMDRREDQRRREWEMED